MIPTSSPAPPAFASNDVPAQSLLPYVIDFENEPDVDLPAQVVTVSQQLDSSLDWSTFQLGDFGFGKIQVQVPPGRQSFHTRINARAPSASTSTPTPSSIRSPASSPGSSPRSIPPRSTCRKETSRKVSCPPTSPLLKVKAGSVMAWSPRQAIPPVRRSTPRPASSSTRPLQSSPTCIRTRSMPAHRRARRPRCQALRRRSSPSVGPAPMMPAARESRITASTSRITAVPSRSGSPPPRPLPQHITALRPHLRLLQCRHGRCGQHSACGRCREA